MSKLFSLLSVLMLWASAFGAGAPAGSVGKLQGAAVAVEASDERMSIAAGKIGWSLAKAKEAAAKDRDLHVSPDNRLFYACKMVAPVGSLPGAASAIQTGPDTSTYTGTPPTVNATTAFQLHSRPGASKVLYLDFNGHTTPANVGGWKTTPIVTPAFQLSGTASPTDQLNLNAIRDIWLHVAEDFAPWDIDVTTEQPPTTARGQRCVIGGSVMDWLGVSGVMGVAHLNSFGGAINLGAGTLNFGVAAAAANASGLNVTGDANFGLPDWSAGSALPITISTGKTLTANASTGINLDAALTGDGSLTIVGSTTAGDRFILGSATGFTGAINLQQGILEADPFVGNTGTARNVSGINVTGDATILGTTYGGIAVPLSVAAGKTATLKGIQAIGPGISGAGTLLVTDSTLSLSGTNTFSGNIRLAGGSLAIVGTANVANVAGLSVENNAGLALSTNDATLAAPITIAASKLLTLSGNHVLTLSGALSGDGALRVNTNGSVVFGSTNTYHGDTALDAGTAFLGANNALGDGTLNISYG
ncbi:MAG: hypothetical protein EBV31_07320, partial [Verrucomicrobia bacterium]|nr:hypothetical protein [Verrucomicrobiota bacterium]